MDTNSTITGRTTTNSISSVRYMSVTAMLTRENTSNSCREKETSHYGHKQYNHR